MLISFSDGSRLVILQILFIDDSGGQERMIHSLLSLDSIFRRPSQHPLYQILSLNDILITIHISVHQTSEF